MKKPKRLILLLVVLAVVCIATVAVSQYQEKQEQIKSSDTVILELPADSVRSVSWELSAGSLGFHKSEDTWLYDEDEAFPVDQEKLLAILENFESFGVHFIIEDVTDYGQYGLDDPVGSIHLETEESSYDIHLGDFSKMDEQRYIEIGDGNVYLVSNDPVDFLETALSGLIQHDDTPSLDTDTVMNIQFSGAEDYTIVRNDTGSDSYSSQDLFFVEINGKNVPLSTSLVRKYLSTVSALGLTNYATYNVREEELEGYGLAEPELSVSIDYINTDDNGDSFIDTCVLHIGSDPEELAAAQEAAESGETAGSVTRYVRIGDSKLVYELDGTDYAILSAVSYNDLRHTEVFWADTDTITQIDILLEGESHSLTLDSEGTWYFGEEELDIDEVLTALTALTADSFTDEEPADKEEISLTVYLDNESFPTVTVQLYRYDGSLCLAVVDGETVSLVARSAVMTLVEAIQSIVL